MAEKIQKKTGKTSKKAEAKKPQPKKTAEVGAGQQPAQDEANVIALPDRQERMADGTIKLKVGFHEGLPRATYQVHDTRLELEGNVFIASAAVNWIPATKCVCKADRPEPITIRKTADGHAVIVGVCNNDGCKFKAYRYIWIHPQEKLCVL